MSAGQVWSGNCGGWKPCASLPSSFRNTPKIQIKLSSKITVYFLLTPFIFLIAYIVLIFYQLQMFVFIHLDNFPPVKYLKPPKCTRCMLRLKIPNCNTEQNRTEQNSCCPIFPLFLCAGANQLTTLVIIPSLPTSSTHPRVILFGSLESLKGLLDHLISYLYIYIYICI